MKVLLIKYKSVIQFIATFLLVYIVLSLCYKFYLDFSSGQKYFPDYLTNTVGHQSEILIRVLGYDAQVIPHPDEPSLKLMVNSKYVARVVEGCNAMSVIILFISFVVAFASEMKTTFIYALAGSVLLYVVNLLRIAILSVGLYEYPRRSDLLHTVIFPMIIYGMMFLLWMIWVNRFSFLRKSHGEVG
ncbi:exosortase family protein XrtF [Mangrovimonas aestuarii]